MEGKGLGDGNGRGDSSPAAPKAERGAGVGRRERRSASWRAPSRPGTELRGRVPGPQRRLPGGRRGPGGGSGGRRRAAEGGGGRRAERLFVVRFDPEGEPETLTFLA